MTTVPPGCTLVPASPAVPSVPGYVITTPQFGWDSGARSETRLEGDVELSFTMELVVGVVVGLCAVDDAVASGDHERISHGFYMFTDGGRTYQFQVMEHGVRIGTQGAYVPDPGGDKFIIRRIGDQVIYTLERGSEVYFRYASRAPLEGEVEVVSALYASGDFIPGGGGG